MAAIEITAADLNRAAACARRWAPVQFEEDAYSAACFALFRAAEKFDRRGTWEGYSGERMRWAVLDELRKQGERFLPAEVAGLGWNDFGYPFLHYV